MTTESPGRFIDNDESALVAAARLGDGAAFAVLVERYRGLVYAYTLARSANRDEAEDLAQEVFARALTALPQLRGSHAWQAWLMQIARNVCRDALRRKRLRRTEPLDPAWLDTGSTPETQYLTAERQQELLVAIAELPESLRVPLIMHSISRCTYREIALATGLPITTVIGRTARAIRVLRKRFQELDQ